MAVGLAQAEQEARDGTAIFVLETFVQQQLPLAFRGKPFSPVCSRGFPQKIGARTPYSSPLLALRIM